MSKLTRASSKLAALSSTSDACAWLAVPSPCMCRGPWLSTLETLHDPSPVEVALRGQGQAIVAPQHMTSERCATCV